MGNFLFLYPNIRQKGFTNLWAMEIDPSLGFTELPEEYFGAEDGQNLFSQGKQVMPKLSCIHGTVVQIKSAQKIRLLSAN